LRIKVVASSQVRHSINEQYPPELRGRHDPDPSGSKADRLGPQRGILTGAPRHHHQSESDFIQVLEEFQTY